MNKLVASLFLVCTLTLGVAQAGAETVNCTGITAVPVVITLPGVYCFTKSFTTVLATGNLISIQANNVVLDMNGYRLGGLGAGFATQAVGIDALNRQNITIRNGTIRGFMFGIRIDGNGGSQGHLVEDIRADQNTFAGIAVQGTGSVIRNNQVVATGGSTDPGVGGDAVGIVALGVGLRVLNNDVVTVVAGTGASVGIIVGDGSDGLAVNNRITSAESGIVYNSSTGKYRDNVTSDVTTPYTGGTDAGNNN